MKDANPVITQAVSATAFIALVKATLAMLIAFHVFVLTEEQMASVNTWVDNVVPILAIVVGAWWASRKVTSLAAPRDADGTPLTRPDNAPAIGELESIQSEALKINQSVDKQADERRIKRP